jgi:hypothetical protein
MLVLFLLLLYYLAINNIIRLSISLDEVRWRFFGLLTIYSFLGSFAFFALR